MNLALTPFATSLNDLDHSFWQEATGLFIQSSVLVILLLIIDYCLRKRACAVFRYSLWMLLLVKLVLPASFALPTGIGYWLGDIFTPDVAITKSVPLIDESVPRVVDTHPDVRPKEVIAVREIPVIRAERSPFDWRRLVYVGWLTGMLGLLVLLMQRAWFVRGLAAKSRPADECLLRMLDACRCRIGIHQKIGLKLSDTSHSPAVCGLFRPVVLMPTVLLEKLSQEKLKAIFMHELAHVKRGDVWVNLLQTLFQIVYFYNPFIWVANAMIRRTREQAVDETVLVMFNQGARQYSNALLDVAEMVHWRPNFSLGLIGIVESKKALERRIRHMLNRPVPKSAHLGMSGFVVIVVIGALLLPMGTHAAQKDHIPATTKVNEEGHLVDKVDYPFVNDLDVIGGWQSVDFVRNINDFDPTVKKWKGDLYLNHFVFEEGGRIAGHFYTWTKGLVLSDDTASQYTLKDINGSIYMFFEWKSGDYTIRHMRPRYYVLRKVLAEGLRYEPMFGKKALIPPTSTINEQGHIVDKVDYPFVNDPSAIGTWKSVDFVSEMSQFKPGKQQWKGRGGELFLKELMFVKNGRVIAKNNKVSNGHALTWTRGLVLSDDTASKYTLKEFNGSTYMFYEWKSGDYTLRRRRPSYYVLKKVSLETGGLARLWADQPSDADFARRLGARIDQLDIDTANLEQVKAIFGTPAQYVWGDETFTEGSLPGHFIMVYPSSFRVFMRDNEIVEIRHERGFPYVFRDKLGYGATLDEAFEVVGHPKKTIEGEKNQFEEGVLYKDINGNKGHCYYARADQKLRLWFSDYKLIAIYQTCSDYYDWVKSRKGLVGIALDPDRWPVIGVLPDMPAIKAGVQEGDKILKVNGKDVLHIATIPKALAVLKGDPGETLKLTVQRDDQILEFEVVRSQ